MKESSTPTAIKSYLRVRPISQTEDSIVDLTSSKVTVRSRESFTFGKLFDYTYRQSLQPQNQQPKSVRRNHRPHDRKQPRRLQLYF
mgnify:CR=1 FL=1